MSRRRLVAFRIAAATLVPAAALLVAEAGLRAANVGYPTTFFLRDGNGNVVENERFTWRFFPREIAREPLHLRFKDPKPADTLRIFVLGESAAQGDPMPPYAFGRMLEVMLEGEFPDKRIEVVNTGVTAINSYVIREIAADCARFEPDLVVAYIGNNEVVGPYGPGTVLTPLLGTSLGIRVHMAVKASRTGQAIERLLHAGGKSKGPERWMGMEHFVDKQIRASDPRMETVHERFRDNLQASLDPFLDADVPVILCTVGVNLRDCPPFASLHRRTITVEELENWEALFAEGKRLDDVGDNDGALAAYGKAAAIDDQHAELRWRLGRCLDRLGRIGEAEPHYAASRDLDTLRFRADSRIGEIVREVAADNAERGLEQVDVEKALADASPGGVPGRKHFYEHVHMNFAGNHVAASAIAPTAVRLLGGGDLDAPLPTEDDCARDLGFIPSEERAVAERVLERMGQAPFTGQADHDEAMAELRESAARLRPRATIEELAEAVARRPRDWRLRNGYAIALALDGRCDLAIPELERAIAEAPSDAPASRNNLARCLMQAGKYEAAERLFREVLVLEPDMPDVGMNLCLVVAGQGRLDEATALFEESVGRKGDLAAAALQLAGLLRRSAATPKARHVLALAMERRPGRELAMAMATVDLELGNLDAAEKGYRAVTANDAKAADAHLGLGRVAEARGDIDAATGHYEKALAIRPGFAEAEAALASARHTATSVAR